MKEMRGEVGKKPPKNEMDNPLFLLRHIDHFWHNFNTIGLCQLYYFACFDTVYTLWARIESRQK